MTDNDSDAATPAAAVRGPASYFPSIEKTYGWPIQHWIDLATAALRDGQAHMAVVTMLKDEHKLGHGHANAVVAFAKAQLAS